MLFDFIFLSFGIVLIVSATAKYSQEDTDKKGGYSC